MVWDFNLANIWLVFYLGFQFTLCNIFQFKREFVRLFYSNRWITFFYTFHSSNANWIWAFGGLGLLGIRVLNLNVCDYGPTYEPTYLMVQNIDQTRNHLDSKKKT